MLLKENNKGNRRQQNNLNLIRRTLRDTQDPFDIPDNTFVKLYKYKLVIICHKFKL